MENQDKHNTYEELEDLLKIRALSAWSKREDDTIDAVGDWVKFKNNHIRRKRNYAILVSCLVVACVCISSTLFLSKPLIENALVADAGVQTVYVPAGQRAQLDMPDGTKVWVNANSTIKYPTLFSKDERRVLLDGEAYFEVAKDESKPFYVESDKATIKVLGTHFNVSDYKTLNTYSASLLEGKVNVCFKGVKAGIITLDPYECVVKNGNSIVKKTFSNEDFLFWRKGIYSFEDCSFKEVIAQLETYYDVKIKILNPEVNDYRISGKCRQRDGIEGFLKPLQKLHHFTYEKDERENTIIIK